LCAAILAFTLYVGCTSLPITEIDCSRFPQAVHRDGSTPPEESEMIDTDTAEKMLLHKEFPRYPELAKRAGLEGTVLIRLWIGKDGTVKQASMVKSDAEIFNGPSLEAAKKLTFKPAACNGTTVSIWATIPIRFKLVN
jgi:TonB family protein